MAEYTKVFENPYPNGWEDLPSENTPITADALQEHTDAIENIEQYLEDNPIEKGGADVEWNQIVESGEEIAEITINGETTKVYAPKGGGGGGEAFVEMTKAEYDALPDTKLTDGVPRLITDYSEGSSGGSGSIDYSTEEQFSGKRWIDGSKIYQKSYVREGSISASGTTIDTIDNFKELINTQLCAMNSSRTTWLSTTSSSNSYTMRVEVTTNGTVQLRGDASWSNPKVNCTIYYTKVGD